MRNEPKRRPGRPPESDGGARNVRIMIYLTAQEAETIQAEADRAGISRGAYVRKKALKK